MNRRGANLSPYRFRYPMRHLARAWRVLSTEGVLILSKKVLRRLKSTPIKVPRRHRIREPGTDYRPNLSGVTSKNPDISIIIPVYNNLACTLQCLYSLEHHQTGKPIEVIVVDDGSTDSTETLLANINGIVAIRNPANIGFVGSANAGANIAKGNILVFLNNDTQVQQGWLDALVDTFTQDPTTAIVGSCLLYPTGRLQEAGCIIFDDASAWNVGHLDDPFKPEYRYLRQVDYVSGASLAIRAQHFEELAGFDCLFAPGYYEDADLAFRARDNGYRVYYQPFSQVIHLEGASGGTDDANNSSMKYHQEANRIKFLQRWTQILQRHGQRYSNLQVLKDRYTKLHTLIIDTYMIMPDRESGSLRLLNIVRILLRNSCKVTFAARNLEGPDPYVSQLQRLGVEVLYRPYQKSIRKHLKTSGHVYDFVFLSRADTAFDLICDVKRFCISARIIYDTVDLHFLREQRLARLNTDYRLQTIAVAREHQELELIRRVHTTLVVSDFERGLLRTKVPDSEILVVSNIHSPQSRTYGFSQRENLLFVGNFRHPPNTDGVIWFIESIFPHIADAIPGIKFYVIGSHPDRHLSRLANESIRILGHVPNIEPYLSRTRVSIAPLRYGAGVKGKINQSLAAGIPTVTTQIGAEGMHLVDNISAMIADTPAEFAAKTVRLYQDDRLWSNMSSAGINIIQEHFSFATAERVLHGLISRAE